MNDLDRYTRTQVNSRTSAVGAAAFHVHARMRSMAMFLIATAIPTTPLLVTSQSDAQTPTQVKSQETIDAQREMLRNANAVRQEVNDAQLEMMRNVSAVRRRRLSQISTILKLPEIANDPTSTTALKQEYDQILQSTQLQPAGPSYEDYQNLCRIIEEAKATYTKAFESAPTVEVSDREAFQRMRSELKPLRERAYRNLDNVERASVTKQIIDLETKLAQSPQCAYTVATVSIPPALLLPSSIFEASLPESARTRRDSSRQERTGIDEVMAQMEKVLYGLQSTVELKRSYFLPDIAIAGPAWEVAEARDLLEAKMTSIADRVNAVQARIFEQAQREEIDRQRHLAYEVQSRLITIDWKGGTLAELLDACKGMRMNVVLVGGEATANAIIPSLSVRDVEPSVFFRALATTPLEDGRWLSVVVTEPTPMKAGSEGGRQGALGEAEVAAAERALPIITISLDPVVAKDAGGGAVVAPSIGTDVYDISAYLKANPGSMEKINDAISAALELSGGIEEIRVRLHEPTGLLFVRGPITQRKAVSQVVQFFTR
jgi:hypothetical protein